MYVREDHKDGDDSTPSGGVLAIWREAQKRFTRAQHIYSIVLIDEVHELKNPHTLPSRRCSPSPLASTRRASSRSPAPATTTTCRTWPRCTC